MAILHLSRGDLLAAAGRPGSLWAEDVALVDLDGEAPGPDLAPLEASLPGIVIGLTAVEDPRAHPAASLCDVVLSHGDAAVEQVLATVAAVPLASRAFVIHMRAPIGTLAAGLAAESAVYSTLQSGPEFAAWRTARPPRARVEEGEPVVLARHGDTLDITLNRPHVRNALNTAMRDALVEAFTLPALDPSITEVHLRGAGESFCSGGDLDEFGSFPDPVTAHLVRLRQSVGQAIDLVADRVTAHLHGVCAGSGIELPAFAGRVVAERGTRISLPELSLGLIPGAGGTVSLTRRIGRHRTTRLALTGEQLDAQTALEWGLVDELVERPATDRGRAH
jgi:enoyl-CoA hydratase/carnithine racemase